MKPRKREQVDLRRGRAPAPLLHSNAVVAAAFAGASDALALFEGRPPFAAIEVNAPFLAFVRSGLEPRDAAGRPLAEILAAVPESWLAGAIPRAAEVEVRTTVIETGPLRYAEAAVTRIAVSPLGPVVLCDMRDVTARVLAERTHEESSARNLAIAHVATEAAALDETRVIDAAASALADFGGGPVAVYLLGRDDRLRRVATRRVSAALLPHLPEILTGAGFRSIVATLESLVPVLLPSGSFVDEAARRFLRVAGGPLLVSAPIRGRERPLGLVLSVWRGRPPIWADVRTFQAITGRTAVAIEQARSVEDVRGERRHLARILDEVPHPIWLADAEGRLTRVNKAGRAFLGPEKDLLARPVGHLSDVLNAIDASGRALGSPAFQRAVRGEAVSGEVTLHRPDGNESVYLMTSVAPLLDRAGRVEEIVAVSTDITDRKRAEDALARGMAQLAAIYRLSDEVNRAEGLEAICEAGLEAIGRTLLADRAAVLIADADGALRYKAARGLSQEFREAMEKCAPWAAGPSGDEPYLLTRAKIDALEPAQRQEVLKEGISSIGGFPLISGGRVLGRIAAYYRQDHELAEEELQLAETIARHLTLALERRRAEGERAFLLDREREARAEAEAAAERAAFLAESSKILAASLDYRKTLAAVAQLAAERIGDWCAIDLVEPGGAVVRLASAHRDPSKASAMPELGRVLARGVPSPVLQVIRLGVPLHEPEVAESGLAAMAVDGQHASLLQKLGTRARVTAPLGARDRTLGAISFGAGRPNRYGVADLALVEDLARRAAHAIDTAILYEESREAVRAREEFLSVASHELKTPLTSLHLHVQILQRIAVAGGRGKLAGAPVAGMLETVERDSQRLLNTINRLLDVARISAGKLALEREDVDLAGVVSDVVGLMQPDFARVSSPVALKVTGPCRGRWDRFRLEQVVTNLVSNAAKYGDGGPIEIAVDGDRRVARLVVTDHGIGIPEDRRKKIFERFERAVSAHHYQGLGLGLYITRQIVEAHGGTLGVESEVGKGSRFTVELPCDGAAEA